MLVAPAYGLAHFFELQPMGDNIQEAAALLALPLEGQQIPTEQWTSVMQALAGCKIAKRGPDPYAAKAVAALLKSLSLAPEHMEEAASNIQHGVSLYILACDEQGKQNGKMVGVAFHTRQLRKAAVADATKFSRRLFNDITDWHKQP